MLACVCRKGDCISLEIETLPGVVSLLLTVRRKGDCISLEIETIGCTDACLLRNSRKGDCISLEIETSKLFPLCEILFVVAKGIASRLRLKLDECFPLGSVWLVAKGIASRLRLKLGLDVLTAHKLGRRKGDCISLEIETGLRASRK